MSHVSINLKHHHKCVIESVRELLSFNLAVSSPPPPFSAKDGDKEGKWKPKGRSRDIEEIEGGRRRITPQASIT